MRIPITCKTEDSIEIEDLRLFQGDLKKINDEELEKIKASILKYGFSFPLFVWNYNILDGHQRLAAVESLIEEGHEIERLPVVFIEAADEKEAAEKLLLINSRYAEISQDGFDTFVNRFNINMDDISQILNLPDIDLDIPNIQQPNENLEDELPYFEDIPKIVNPGQLWQIGKHFLLCADCTDKTQVQRLMQDHTAELLFTSPPYSDMRQYAGNDLSIDTLIRFIASFEPYCKYQVVNLGLKKKDHEIVEYWSSYIEAARDAGYKFLSWNVWDKLAAGSIGAQKRMFAIEHEWILVFGKTPKKLNRTIEKSNDSDNRKRFKRRDIHGRMMRKVRQEDGSFRYSTLGEISEYKNLGTVIQVTAKGPIGKLLNKHPAAMPVELSEIYIEAMTNEEDIVVEPFAGSGTTLIAAQNTKRTCFAMELNPDYCNLIIERFKRNFEGDILLIA